jgi:hypothetical protein
MVTFGFARRGSVLDVESAGRNGGKCVYDAARILHRSRMIAYAADARRQRFPDETSFDYAPLADGADACR